MPRNQVLAAIVAALGLAAASAASAQQTSYELTLTIERIDHLAPCRADLPFSSFGCVGLGNTFSGEFAVDSSILTSDGINRTAAIYNFYLPFGSLVYSTGPLNTALAGFRNPSLGAAAPGFVIEGGQVTDLYGGVYALGDAPFIDMYGYGPQARNQFYAFDGATAAYGTLTIASPAPEPQNYAMTLAGLVFVGLVVRRRRKAG